MRKSDCYLEIKIGLVMFTQIRFKMKNKSQLKISESFSQNKKFSLPGFREQLHKLNLKFFGFGNPKRKIFGGLSQFVKIEMTPHRKHVNVPVDLFERHNQQRLAMVYINQN
jgi:hypothetical protein